MKYPLLQSRHNSSRNGEISCLGVVLLAVVGLIVLVLIAACLEQEADQDLQTFLGNEIAKRGIETGKDEGDFSHDIHLTNTLGHDYTKCDLIITIYYSNGARPEVSRYWSTWASQETKTITVPAKDRIERIDIKGELVITLEGEEERATLNHMCSW